MSSIRYHLLFLDIFIYLFMYYRMIRNCTNKLCNIWIWMSINVQRNATIYSFIIFMQTALHVSDDTLIHHQETLKTVIISGNGRTVFANVRWPGGVPTTPRQRTVANTVRPVPDVVITVLSVLLMMDDIIRNMLSCLQKYNKTVYSHISLESYWHWFTMHGSVNIKYGYGF